MSAQYDGIAAEYSRTKTSPVREHIETWSFWRRVGDVRGLRVLDLACGDGFYARQLKRAGAAQVTAVDISADMIALARAEEAASPLGIEYHCADVAALGDLGRFDLVTAAYCLHYAPDVPALQAMCRRIAAQLGPGGRLVAINENPAQQAPVPGAYTAYGFDKRLPAALVDGAPIEYAMASGRRMLRFSVWYYTRDTYESALRAAGFTQLSWLPLELNPAGLQAHGAEFWQPYLANPPVIGLEARL